VTFKGILKLIHVTKICRKHVTETGSRLANVLLKDDQFCV